MITSASGVSLTAEEREELETRIRSRSGRADAAQRARIILLLANDVSYSEIAHVTGCSSATIALWKKRFAMEGLPGLSGRHRGSKPRVLTAKLEARVLNWTRKKRPHGATHWSTRTLGKHLGVSHTIIARAWQRAGLQPHRLERYMRSNDPDFETKAADIIGLYLNPPEHAVVFCVDEKTAIQALDRRDRVLPLSPGRAERHGFEYIRNGTLSLYAALETRTGAVIGRTVPKHNSDAFVAFLAKITATVSRNREIHVIADNLSAHKTAKVEKFLSENPNVTLHFTPTYSAWLNQVELWFSKVERDVIARGIFTSAADLARKLRRYIDQYNKTATPFRWSYSDPTKRIA